MWAHKRGSPHNSINVACWRHFERVRENAKSNCLWCPSVISFLWANACMSGRFKTPRGKILSRSPKPRSKGRFLRPLLCLGYNRKNMHDSKISRPVRRRLFVLEIGVKCGGTDCIFYFIFFALVHFFFDVHQPILWGGVSWRLLEELSLCHYSRRPRLSWRKRAWVYLPYEDSRVI